MVFRYLAKARASKCLANEIKEGPLELIARRDK